MEKSIPVSVEQLFHTEAETLWAALTEVSQMRQWYFDAIPDFKAQVGFKTQFNVQAGGRDFPHVWKVTEVIPLQKISYDWEITGYEIDSYVNFELAPKEGNICLTLNCHGIESYPDNIPEFTRESCHAGWTYFIKESLPNYINALKKDNMRQHNFTDD